jgi:signal transduction histidine kinase
VLATTCKEIVKRHGGRIWVGSELGKGVPFIHPALVVLRAKVKVAKEERCQRY